jgi:hypothetical protein
VVSSATSIILTEMRNLREVREGTVVGSSAGEAAQSRASPAREPFLRIPPFPGSKVRHFARLPSASSDLTLLAAKLLKLRVGGSYWAAQPALPDRYVLVRALDASNAAKRMSADPVICWTAGVFRSTSACAMEL